MVYIIRERFGFYTVNTVVPMKSSCKSYAKLSHHQLQDAIDVGLATQALIHKVRFDIKQSHHQLQNALDIGLTTHLVDRCLCCQADV